MMNLPTSLLSYVLILTSMPFFILMELKLLGYYQTRKGPNKVSIMGVPQPIADALKLFTKEPSSPSHSNKSPFILSPLMNLTLSLLFWTLLPSSSPSMIMKFSFLLFLCLSSLNVYTTLGAGWASNSKYALLGALRSVAQTISYEVSMALILISILLFTKTLSTQTLLTSYFFNTLMINPILFLIWFTTTLAETNRAPFDFVEGESELVSGFNTEYASNPFALIFMAEYLNILFMSMLTTLILTSSLPLPLIAFTLLTIKTSILAALFATSRATLPRLRYDHLMKLTWSSFLPVTLSLIIFLTSSS